MSLCEQPAALAVIAGKGAYPLLLASSARSQGVKRVIAVAFRKETRPGIVALADETHWVHLGQLGRMLDALRASGVRHAVMAGQITPTHLFRIRMDAAMLALLKRLEAWNAHTIFGAIAEELHAIGIELLPASSFMREHMPAAGLLTRRAPEERERQDIALGLEVARATSALDIGQTVVVKQGTILAVEAFEGTDAAILRAGKLGGAGSVVVKAAKRGHDMRFDIPVVGMHTVRILRRARVAAVAVESGRCILLERKEVVDAMDRLGIAMTATATEGGTQP